MRAPGVGRDRRGRARRVGMHDPAVGRDLAGNDRRVGTDDPAVGRDLAGNDRPVGMHDAAVERYVCATMARAASTPDVTAASTQPASRPHLVQSPAKNTFPMPEPSAGSRKRLLPGTEST